ncbi:unnamed protein product [Arabidopsis lyrata]|uniref:Uncharacterized protein n=1 Tax=Arabidopsis lyrata subsp. lyrata TaxID=81972 RepID=D7KGS5_ARALL|nr:uncharacterized protein LOC9327654 [Arabidopsis lyrata subsp. lyrata]EFH67851.1 hypothetical protein ARALYDRAFT_892014 [Arabidopsis lyrata subsp. lyrata]CAH8255213.1 unnamed protein product [Arabidopsis lyrata]|eukprot:XP_002891592.1 uncharacterized protein LOC9327654 [Arabidopsis lyrata subsp. lyrata]
MWCACYHQPLPASSIVLNRQAKQEESLRRKQVLFFLSSSPSSLSSKQQWKISNYPKNGFRLKPKASMVPPSESGDITTFLLVSGAMISMYLVTNFLVPSLLFKSLQGEEEEEDEDSG